MPACPSSPIDPVVDQLVDLADELDLDRPELLAALRSVPDPRHRRGIRHSVGAILAIAACAVLTGARSFTAIAGWAADTGSAALAALGVGPVVPCESTIRRTLQRLDGDALDTAIGAWAARRTQLPGRRRFIAVDGKSVRGAIGPTGVCRHLMAAITHHDGVVLGQVNVDVKTNEIPLFSVLLDRIDITGAVITADALHVQRAHAHYLHARDAHYLLTVKANQPTLLAQLQSLPWQQVPTTHTRTGSGHGRREKRSIKILTVHTGIGFPHAAQAIQITRKVKDLHAGPWRTETVHGITSLAPGQARHDVIADGVRGHWTVENKLHWVRDCSWREDASQIRTGNGPRVMASLRNLAISVLRLAGHDNIAGALRHYARRSDRPITCILTS